MAAGTFLGTAYALASTAPPSESDNDLPVAAQNCQQDMIQLPTHQLTNLVISSLLISTSNYLTYTSSCSASEVDIVEPFPKVARGVG